MMRDDSTGGWLPLGGGGLSNVSVRKRKIHHEEYDQPCRHEYLIHGKRISDSSVSSLICICSGSILSLDPITLSQHNMLLRLFYRGLPWFNPVRVYTTPVKWTPCQSGHPELPCDNFST